MISLTMACLMTATINVAAQTADGGKNNKKLKAQAFLCTQEWPEPAKYLSKPIATDSLAFMNDAYRYLWGKQQRRTPLGELAAADEKAKPAQAFSAAVGFTVNSEEYPEIFKLVEGACKDAMGINIRSKNHFQRIRPFVYYGEPSLVSETDSIARESFGYPSGHATRGWVYALTLALVVPDSTEALIRRAQEFSLNRVICGRHYKSDIEASLIEANAIMCRLHSNEAFLAQLSRARKEYAEMRGKR